MAELIKNQAVKGKKKLIKLWSVIISFFLGVFGFQAYSCMPAAYGCPSADYKFSGTVTDNVSTNSISGLSVKLLNNNPDWQEVLKEATTDAEGNYILETDPFCVYFEGFIITVKDVDGAVNNQYFDQTVDVPVSDNDYVGESGWYMGKVDKIVNIEMDEDN